MASITSKFRQKLENPASEKLEKGQSLDLLPSEKERLALVWIFEHGIATAEIIRRATRREKLGSENNLVKKGLLVKTRATAAHIPRYFFTLSETGVKLAEKFSKLKINYRHMEPYKISQNLFRHNFIAQALTLDAIEHGLAVDYISPEILKKKYATDAKIPDAAWIDQDSNFTAVEVELNQKWGRYRDQMIFEIFESLQKNEYSRFIFFSQSPATLKNYESSMKAGAVGKKWVQTFFGEWEIMREFEIPDWMPEKLQFRLIDKKYI